MKREDVGFIVSRALSVWVATLAIRQLAMLPYIFMMLRESAKASAPSFSSRLGYTVALEDIIWFGGVLFFAVLLWTRPRLLFPGGPEPISENTEINVRRFRSVAMSAVGFYVFVEGFSSLMSNMMARHTFAIFSTAMWAQSQYQWEGPLAQVGIGACIVIWFSYGPSIMRFLGLDKLNQYPMDQGSE
jgi:hypothetical protein